MRLKLFLFLLFLSFCSDVSIAQDANDSKGSKRKFSCEFLEFAYGPDHLEPNNVSGDDPFIEWLNTKGDAHEAMDKITISEKTAKKTIVKKTIERVDKKSNTKSVLTNTSYDEIIEEASMVTDLDPHLLKAVISVESDFNPRAQSAKGAQGLTQLMPETSEKLGIKKPFDPHENIHGGAKVLSKNMDIFDGDLRLALAAYNAGPEKVKENKGIPKFPETQKFVRDVMQTYAIYKNQG